MARVSQATVGRPRRVGRPCLYPDTEMVTLTIRIPASARRRLDREAARAGLNISEFVRERLGCVPGPR